MRHGTAVASIRTYARRACRGRLGNYLNPASGRQAVVSQARPSCRRTCWSFLPPSRRCTKGGLYLRGCFPQLCDSVARQLPGGANLTAPKEKPRRRRMAAGLSAVARRYLHPRIVANLLDPAGRKDLAERQQPRFRRWASPAALAVSAASSSRTAVRSSPEQAAVVATIFFRHQRIQRPGPWW